MFNVPYIFGKLRVYCELLTGQKRIFASARLLARRTIIQALGYWPDAL